MFNEHRDVIIQSETCHCCIQNFLRKQVLFLHNAKPVIWRIFVYISIA